ncbi:MAG: Asp23/Gls24 family envelope stress response protein [Oscillospiraceae bacterium]|nr:Asp23/Gls24 family envelope stress response protein [Oscillospiraceae bacterium]
MGEGREYISHTEEMGSIQISEDVIAIIAAMSASEVEGIGNLAANIGNDIAEFLGKKNLSRGIKVQISENTVTVDVTILVRYGYTIPETAKLVQNAVYNGLEAMAGLAVRAVNVHVGGVVFEKVAKHTSEK